MSVVKTEEKEKLDNNRKIIFSKIDFWRAVIAGVLIATLSLPIFKNLGVFGFCEGSSLFFVFIIILWILSLPLATAFGLGFVYKFLSPKWPVLYQIGKYGIIGLLNTFLTAGILNLLILISGIARGLWFDVFVVIAFTGGITNAFFWNKFWTFNSGGTGKTKEEYIKFFVVSGVVAVVNAVLMHVLVNVLGPFGSIQEKVWANISFLMLIPVSFLGNFWGYKLFVFKRKLVC
ncbi:MAG: GtrA family protein [Candidatus Marinimicrobia bacterium]|nr:GtrA family protein [Candidatus Neomarinimicrobiota bacterium]